MKRFIALLILAFAVSGWSRDDVTDQSIKAAFDSKEFKSRLGNGIKFYFAGQPHGQVVKNLGEFKSNKKTSSFFKSEQRSCEWALLAVVLTLKKRAQREGGNAIINIRSNYRGNQTESDSTYQCGVGAAVAGVALIGDIVQIDTVSVKPAEPAVKSAPFDNL